MMSVPLFTLLYGLAALCLVAPPGELRSLGLTVQNLCAGYLGREDAFFVHYHMLRSSITIFLHSLLPLGYYICLGAFQPELGLFTLSSTLPRLPWCLFLAAALVTVLTALVTIFYWKSAQWARHPLARVLRAHATPVDSGASFRGGEPPRWERIAAAINREFGRVDKFSSGPPSCRIYITDNWIIKSTVYRLDVALKSDVHLQLLSSDEHALRHNADPSVSAPTHHGPVQYLNIRVHSINSAVHPFTIRLNALEYGDLCSHLRAPVINVRNVVIKQSLSDRFLVAFKEQISLNPTYQYNFAEDSDHSSCIGCLVQPTDIKLRKLCGSRACQDCLCRPMWCVDCVGKWYASRQDQARPDLWLGASSPCPTCRSVFCLLDVCPVVKAT